MVAATQPQVSPPCTFLEFVLPFKATMQCNNNIPFP